MNCLSVSILVLCAVFSSAWCRGSHEHPHHHHGPNYHLPICPDCDWSLTTTYAQYVVKTLTGGGPPDGRCHSGYEPWIYKAEPYGLKNDVCCCLKLKVVSIDCNHPSSPVCPPIPKIGRNEYIQDYFFRVSRQLKDAPENGCCPLGTFKWIFEKALTGTKDLCSCINKSDFQDDSMCIGSRLSSVYGPVDTTPSPPDVTTNIPVSTTAIPLTTAPSGGTTVSTTVPGGNVCPLCELGASGTIYDEIKKMFDKHGPSDGVCAASTQKLNFPGFVFGYTYDMCCCVAKIADLNCASFPPPPTCPTTPGLRLSETYGEYLTRAAAILVNAPENGCCNFGTVKFPFVASITGFPKDICTCLDFTKAIDSSTSSDTTASTATSGVTTVSTATSGGTTATTASGDAVCPLCVLGTDDTIYNEIKKMFDKKGPTDGVCAASTQKLNFPGFVFGYTYDMCCCVVMVADLNCASFPPPPTCPTTPGLRLSETYGEYLTRAAALLKDAPENGCCNFGTVKFPFVASISGLPKDICTCLDFTKAIDLSGP